MSELAENYTCPNYEAKLEAKETCVRKCQHKSYLNVLTTCGKYQIICIFLISVLNRKDKIRKNRRLSNSWMYQNFISAVLVTKTDTRIFGSESLTPQAVQSLLQISHLIPAI